MPYDEYFEDRCIAIAEREWKKQSEKAERWKYELACEERRLELQKELDLEEDDTPDEWHEDEERRMGLFFNWIKENPFEDFYRGSKYPFPFCSFWFDDLDIFHKDFVPYEVTREFEDWLYAKEQYMRWLKWCDLTESAKVDLIEFQYLRQFGKTTDEQMHRIWEQGKERLPRFQREAFVEYTNTHKNTILQEFETIIRIRAFAKAFPDKVIQFNV